MQITFNELPGRDRLPVPAKAIIIVLLAAQLLPSQSVPVRFSLEAAVRAAPENNASILVAEESKVQLGLEASERRAALLPHFAASGGFTDETVSPAFASSIR